MSRPMSRRRNNDAVPENPRGRRESASENPAEVQDKQNEQQKGMFGRIMDTIDAPGRYLVEKPVSWITGSKSAGKVAKYLVYAGLLGAAGYYFMDVLRAGAVGAFQGGNTLLDRIGRGAGRLFPAMEMAPASPYNQLPPVSGNPMMGT